MSLKLGSSFARLNAGPSSVKRMFRGASGVWNADAADWVRRVEANGGSVSTATVGAVTEFCNAIDAAGIRGKFFRLNVFCGTGLNACLVPLYRGQSLDGTQYGNATDTNNGPFVSGSFSEATGLTSNGTTQYLDTGLPANFNANRHATVYFRSATALYRRVVGIDSPEYFAITGNNPAVNNYGLTWSGTGLQNIGVSTASSNASEDGDLLTVTSFGSPLVNTYYENDVAFAPVNTGVSPSSTLPMYVFSSSNAGPSATLPMAGALYGYSFGVGMSVADLTLYKSAVSALATALGRTP